MGSTWGYWESRLEMLGNTLDWMGCIGGWRGYTLVKLENIWERLESNWEMWVNTWVKMESMMERSESR